MKIELSKDEVKILQRGCVMVINSNNRKAQAKDTSDAIAKLHQEESARAHNLSKKLESEELVFEQNEKAAQQIKK